MAEEKKCNICGRPKYNLYSSISQWKGTWSRLEQIHRQYLSEFEDLKSDIKRLEQYRDELMRLNSIEPCNHFMLN